MGIENLRKGGGGGRSLDLTFDENEIRLEDVFSKTPLGVAEVRDSAGTTLPSKLRTVLMLIDGRTPFNSFKTTLHTYGDITQIFSILRDLSLIVKTSSRVNLGERISPSASPPPQDSNREPEPNLDSARGYSPLDAATQSPHMAARIASAERGYDTQQPMSRPSEQTPQTQPASAPRHVTDAENRDVDLVKMAMSRDVSALLGTDAAVVIAKIQGCRNKDDLFVTMMGIKKIITVYTNKSAAENFAKKYQLLSL